MKPIVAILKLALGAVVGWWLGLHSVIQLLIVLMGFDVLTGVIVAVIEHNLSSDVSWKGMGKKALTLVLVAVAETLDRYLGIKPDIGELVAGFYCAHEGLSIIENAIRAGLPVPAVLRDVFAKLSPEKFDSSQADG